MKSYVWTKRAQISNTMLGEDIMSNDVNIRWRYNTITLYINVLKNNLKTLANKIDDKKMNKPEFLMVLIGIGDYAYKREDGVYIVPIGCLKN